MLIKSECIAALAKALNEASKEFGEAVKGADNPYFSSKYADLNSIIKAVKPGLDKSGIVVLQPLITGEGGKTYLQTMLLHTSGEYIASVIPLDLSGKEQAVGSRLSYFRRYQLQALLSVPAVDDDGEGAMNRPGNEQGKGAKNPPAKPADNRKKVERLLQDFAALQITRDVLETKLGKSVYDMNDDDFARASTYYDAVVAKVKPS